ncbi:hypothetical protein KKF61_04525 [Patescibacteria group bacterium]|nr:hypothetical protein [Patescibacteria group bacterium]
MSEKLQHNPESPIDTKPRYQMWESRVDQSTMEEVGVYDPDRNYHELAKGDSFSVIRDRENNHWTAKITHKDGKETILEEGKIIEDKE